MRVISIILTAAALFAIAAFSLRDEQEDISTAKAIWEEMSGFQSWRLVPGTSAKMPGKAPHGKLVTIYANDKAAGAMETNQDAMPEGAIIAKENFGLYSDLTMVTSMKKIGTEWFWAVFKTDGSVVKAGYLKGCGACHQRALRDGVFTWPTE